MSVGSLVTSGPLILAIPVAVAAGAVTFLSPCSLPLVPGYLSYITGMSRTTLADDAGATAAPSTDDSATDDSAGAEAATATEAHAGGTGSGGVTTRTRKTAT